MLHVIRTKKIWLGFSAALIVLSLAAVAIFGLRLGIDFTGGSLTEISFSDSPTVEEVRSVLAASGFAEARVQPSGENAFLIRLRFLTQAEREQISNDLSSRFGETKEVRFQSVGPIFGAELMRKAFWAIGLVLLLIALYVAYAFRHVSEPVASWKYGVITLIAAFHDILIPIGVFAVLGRFFGFRIDSSFVVALLTVLGYSINDTIVVFDRIRENLVHRSSGQSLTELVQKSIQQTFTRSLNTSLTTLLALLAVFTFGGETTRSFALAMIIGIVAGTYSSIFVASPLLVMWERRRGR